MRLRSWLLVLGLSACLLTSAAAVALAFLGVAPGQLMDWAGERPPAAILRYAEERLKGHPKLEALAAPLASRLRARLEPEPPPQLADLGKGQRKLGLPAVRHDPAGRPLPVALSDKARIQPQADFVVPSVTALRAALDRAAPGSVIEILPGEYTLSSSLPTPHAGTALQPITVRARTAGTVTFLSRTVQAVVVSQPYWIFENLDWRGSCDQDSSCEHAFHVVGRARGTVIVNNRLSDFNAQIKVNGEDGRWPDDGLVQFNSLENSRTRNTDNPVTPIDLVAANGWQLLDNRVANFAKTAHQHVSYGMFMKGGGARGRIERNLVICTPQQISQSGSRVGISLGNGGTDQKFCREGQCRSEHQGGVVANNVVAHCNDAGIDISKATDSLVIHNTLINTQGIVVRNPPATAEIRYNVLSGAIRNRAQTQAVKESNLADADLSVIMSNADALDLRWRQLPNMNPKDNRAGLDFCGSPRQAVSPPGATVSPSC